MYLPSELDCRLAPVAICTSNFALRDLIQDRLPTQSQRNHDTDIPFLRAPHMIELKNDWIRFSAVDARPGADVLRHRRSISPYIFSSMYPSTLIVCAFVSTIVLTAVFALAWKAVSVRTPRVRFARWKLSRSLDDATLRAALWSRAIE
jgi:hypothetical protein